MRPFVILLVFFSLPAQSQRIENVKISKNENNLTLEFDLISENENDIFEIGILKVIDNTPEIVQNVTGDVGLNVEKGFNKKAIIDLEKEFGGEPLSVKFIISAIVSTPFVTIILEEQEKIKRGKNRLITWEGGDGDEILAIELHQLDSLIEHLSNSLNTGSFLWKPSSDLVLGKDYQLKIININNPMNYSLSEPFELTSKYPWPVKVGAILASAGIISIIGQITQGDSVIPDPPTIPK